MKTQAEQFGEQMAAVSGSVEKSNAVASKFSFKAVRFMKHGGRKGLRFADGSKLFFGEEGKLIFEGGK